MLLVTKKFGNKVREWRCDVGILFGFVPPNRYSELYLSALNPTNLLIRPQGWWRQSALFFAPSVRFDRPCGPVGGVDRDQFAKAVIGSTRTGQ